MSRFVIWGNGTDTLFTLMPPEFFSGFCGGQGLCGKCRVAFLSEPPAPSEKEREILGAEELDAGVRLACFCRPGKKAHTIALPESLPLRLACKEKSVCIKRSVPREEDCGIAIDIGTTTISMQLLTVPGGIVLAENSYLNSQRYFGADVISRLKAASEGKEGRIGEMLRSDIPRGIEKLLDGSDILQDRIVRIVIAANTVMDHFLLGLPVSGLGAAPFSPYSLEFPPARFDSVFNSGDNDSPLNAVPVKIIPCISTFIGGDITAGLAALNITETEGPALFVDIGTNAEIVLSYRGKLLCCSAAAGPAFEGGISCGTGTVPGAVYSVTLEKNSFVYKYFENDCGVPGPQGLCGSGVIDFVAESIRAGLIDAYGIPAPVFGEQGILLDSAGKIRLTAGDIRQVLLAKAAIRAGIQVLMDTAGIAASDIAAVYLAGSFGYHLKESSILKTGLFPEEFSGRIYAAGNTSLAGAAGFLAGHFPERLFEKITGISRQLPLADNPLFNACFLKFMKF